MIEPEVDWIIVFRAIGVAEFALILGLLLKQHGNAVALRLSQLLVACVLCYLLAEAFRPDSIAQRPPFVWYALISVALALPALYWALARAVFTDGFVWTKTEWWIIGGYEVSAVLFLGADYFWKFELGRSHLGLMSVPLLMQIGLSVWTLYIIIESWRSDLMESRRRLRLVAALLVGSYTLFSLIFELTGINTTREQTALLIHTATIAMMGFIGLLSLGKINLDTLYLSALNYVSEVSPEPIPAPQQAPISTQALPHIDNWESHLTRIRNQRLYALENMTIAKLAETLSVPEYRLRKQIAQSTQFKNFNQFLNHFRIEEASLRLTSAQERSIPILTIALDVGFRSLPSFNRSFKEQHRMTPSEYRKSALS